MLCCVLVLLAAGVAHAQTPISHHAPKISARDSAEPTTSAVTSGADKAPQDLAVIFLDPAHGGSDDGAHLRGDVLEKDVTLAFAIRLRDLLSAKGFKIVLTRANPAVSVSGSPSEDERAELANRSNASACLLLHVSNGGHGVHLYTSSLSRPVQPTHAHPASAKQVLPWESAQRASLSESIDLRSDLATAINGAQIPLVAGGASVKPIDSLLCPAVAIELAPYTPASGAVLQPTDPGYQQQVAEAIVSALGLRRQRLQTATGSGMEKKPHTPESVPKNRTASPPVHSAPGEKPARQASPPEAQL